MRRVLLPALVVGAVLVSFASGWFARQELVGASPKWVADFADAFCRADAKYVSSHTGGTFAASEDEIRTFFSRQQWRCDGVRYLGKVKGQGGGLAYVFVLRDAGNDREAWYVFTTEGETVVGIE